MSIAVVVLTHNRVHLLRHCVEQVLAKTSAATTEIVIWDNASTDDTPAYLTSLADPRLRVVLHPENIGQNGYAEGFALTTAPYLVELDDDVIDAPAGWDATLLDAFRRLPTVGFLAADLEDNPHDLSARYRYEIRPHLYVPFELNGVRLLEGPAGGGCAMTSRELVGLVGGFPQNKKRLFFEEETAYIGRLTKHGYRAAVLRDLRVFHAGGPYYGSDSEVKASYWAYVEKRQRRRTAVKRALVRVPFVRRLNARRRWFEAPS